MMKRSLALLLAMIMVLSMLPMSIWAEGQSTAEKNTAYTAPLEQHAHAASGDGHICEHCVANKKTGAEAVPEWKVWDKSNTKLPDKAGHWYLNGDMTVKGVTLTNADVVICLNGYTVTPTSGERFYTLNTGSVVTILDCTAKTVTPDPAIENDTGYRAGKLTGAANTAAFMLSKDHNGKLYMYDGILFANNKGTGALMSIQGSAEVHLYGGEVRENTSTSGGCIYLGTSKNVFEAENVGFIGNTAVGSGGVFNAPYSSKVTVTNCSFIGNSAGSGGVYYGKGGSFTATGCTFTGNSAKDYSVFCGSGGGIKVTLDSCRITENVCTNSNGAIFVPNDGAPLTLKGNTYIYGNTNKAGAARNIYLQKDGNGKHPVVTVDGLTSGAKIGFSLASDRLAASKVLSKELGGKLTRAQVVEYFYSDDASYMVDLVGDKLTLAQGHVHTAHLDACSVADCKGHDNALYLPLTASMAFPTSGSYCLEEEYTLTDNVALTTGTLNLCLNGQTLKLNGKRFNISGDATLNITDCKNKTENNVYTAGSITGGTNSVFNMLGDTDNSGKKCYVNIYEGIITGNERPKDHASVAFIEKKATFNLYGGEISGNTVGAGSTSRGGTVYLQDNTAIFNMYGGKISNNNAVKNGTYGGNGGAIYSRDRGTVNILGGEISGNTAANQGGAIWASGGKVTVKDAKITGNSAAQFSAINGAAGAQITLDGAEITGNTTTGTGLTYGAIYIPNNTARITIQGATKVTGNTGGNIYLRPENAPMLTLGNLSDDARIVMTVPAARVSAQPYVTETLGNKLTEQQVTAIFSCDDNKYEAVLDNDRVMIREAGAGHKHCICGVKDCTAHEQIKCQPWNGTDTLPTTTGFWHLTKDITVKGATLDGANVVLCLNGHTVTGKTGDRFYTLKNSAKLTIVDCGPYHDQPSTGLMTGATNTGFMFEDKKANVSVLNWYGGNLTNISRGNAGGAFCVQGSSTLNIYGGTFDTCRTTGGTVGGGLAYLSGTATVNLKDATIKNCSATGDGGVISNPYKGKVTITGCTFTGNTATNRGAVYYGSGGSLTINGSTFTGNSAKIGGVIHSTGATVTVNDSVLSGNTATSAGAIYAHGGKLTVTGTQITGNEAQTYSAINGAGGGVQITLDGAQITGNKATAEGLTYGAVYIPNSSAKLIVQGATKVVNNEGGNVYLIKNTNAKNPEEHSMIALGAAGLASGAKIGVTMPNDRMGAQPYASVKLDGALTDAQVAEYFSCDNDRYAITLKEDRLHIAKFYVDIGHKHCLCDDSVGACDHKSISWLAWDDPKSLPTSGNYCLTVDVKTSANVSLTGNSVLNLCLNGHTIEAGGKNQGTWQDRIFDIKEEATLNITDCTGKGKLTGGTYGVILFEDNQKSKTTFNLYGGNLTGNKGLNYGGAVLVQGGGTMNMYGGAIHGNNMNGTAVVDANGKPVLDETGAQKTTGTSYGGGAVGLNGTKTTFNMYGGKIYNNECLLTTYLDKDGKEATAGGRGGAIYSTRGTVNIYGGEISGNRANQGGAIYAVINSKINVAGGSIAENKTGHHGAGIFADNCTVTISGGQITKNVSEKGAGGVQISNGKGVLTVTGGEITENAGYYGGGIMCQGRASINIEGGLIARNKADTAGGVYIATLSPAKLTGGTITENEAVNNAGGLYALRTILNMTGGEIAGNKAGREGGGMYMYGSTLNMEGGVVKNNTAKNGGGISTGRLTVTGKLEDHVGMNALIDSKGKLECRALINLVNGSIEGNSSTGAGGGLLIQGCTILNVKGGAVKNNSSKSSGGGTYVSSNCTVNMTDGVYSGNHADGTGGGMYVLNAKAEFAGGVFEKNTTKKQGAGMCTSNSEIKLSGVKIRNHNHKGVGAAYAGMNSNTTMSGGSITGNYAGSYGAGMYLQRGKLTITGGSMTGNSTKGTGAAIYLAGIKANIYGGYFAGNKCEGTGGPVLFTARWGYKENGVKKEDVCSVNIAGGTFTENYGRNGGAMLIQSGATLKITGGKFTKNEGPQAGGALYISNNIKFEITGGTFTENKTDVDGGAINFNGAQGVLDGANGKLIFENNYAKRYGGAFNVTGEKADVTVKNLKVSKNSVSNRGGGVAVNTKAHVNLENIEIFENHSAIQGGGFYMGHGPVVYMKDSKIHHNTSDAAGAAVATECVGEMTMENVVISNNETKTKSGGVYTRAAKMHLINCQVIDNVAGGDGGGVATGKLFTRGGEIGSGGKQDGLIIENSVITGNTCVGAGGGVHLNPGNYCTIINSEISGNTSGTEGSGIWTTEHLDVQGMTVTGNTSKNNGYAVYIAEANYDGQSYIQALLKMSGDVIVKDNVGGEMFMGAKNAIAISAEGLGEKTEFDITLDSGVLTNRLLGLYNYERSEDGIYTVTYGDRSLTEPEFFAETGVAGGDTLLYIGVGAFVVVAAAAAVVLILLKKKKAKAAPAAQE